jgi:CheY-like chemotaxis protein
MRVCERRDNLIDILIAEDDAPARAGVRLLLEQQGYRCAEAGNGREAVELARRYRPRCVLLDLRMPELDGFTVARRLRADPRTRDAAIHCLTGLTDETVREEAHAAGCERFLAKPVDAADLLEAVRPQPSAAEEWVGGLTMTQAEELLDWLEAHGAAGELNYEEGKGFAVRRTEVRAGEGASGRAGPPKP